MAELHRPQHTKQSLNPEVQFWYYGLQVDTGVEQRVAGKINSAKNFRFIAINQV